MIDFLVKIYFFSRLSATQKYQEGKDLLFQADKLMAMVHAAKMDATNSNTKINDLINKAEQLYDQLAKFHADFADVGEQDTSG